jgi:GNAT superfamily N-acetyltransferase
MFYDEVEIGKVEKENAKQTLEVLAEEFPDHKDTDLSKEYEWILVAKKSNIILGVITANKYIPKKALLCDIVVRREYRSKGIGIKLLKHMGILLKSQGYTHLLGFTPKKSRDALRTYRRVHTNQEEMIVTTSELNISIPHIEQMEMILQARETRRKNNKE